MVRVLVSLGIEKVRLTGGEPLSAQGRVEFVRELAKLRTLERRSSSTSRLPPTAIYWPRWRSR